MVVDKLAIRAKIFIPKTWPDEQKSLKGEVQSKAEIILHKLLEDADITAGDDMTIDVKVLIEKK